MDEPIVFDFTGHAETAGSKNPMIPKYGDGRPVRRHRQGCAAFTDKDLPRTGWDCQCPIMVNTVDDNPHSEAWKEAVGYMARNQYKGPLLDGALIVECTFYRTRPAGHSGTGRNAGIVKDSAPAKPITRPDVLKTMRAIEDALTGVVWKDDSLIVDEYIAKRYGDHEHVVMRVWVDEAQTVGDLVSMGADAPSEPRELFEQLALVA